MACGPQSFSKRCAFGRRLGGAAELCVRRRQINPIKFRIAAPDEAIAGFGVCRNMARPSAYNAGLSSYGCGHILHPQTRSPAHPSKVSRSAAAGRFRYGAYQQLLLLRTLVQLPGAAFALLSQTSVLS
jgi:hypothetical protein